MNSEQLNAIKERAEKATPGEWKARGLNVLDYARVEVDINDYESKVIVKSTNNSDIKFIAHAREDIPQLVAEVERLKSAITYACEMMSIGESGKANDRLTEALGVPYDHFEEESE